MSYSAQTDHLGHDKLYNPPAIHLTSLHLCPSIAKKRKKEREEEEEEEHREREL